MVRFQQAKQQAVQTGLPVFVSMQVQKNAVISQAQMAVAWAAASQCDRVVSITSNYKPRVHPKNPHMKLTHMQNFDHLRKGQMYRVKIRRDYGLDETAKAYRDIYRTPLPQNRSASMEKAARVSYIESGSMAVYLEQNDENIKVMSGDVVGWIQKDEAVRFQRITARMLRRAEAFGEAQVFPDDC